MTDKFPSPFCRFIALRLLAILVLAGLLILPAGAFADNLAPTALNSFTIAPARLATASVLDTKGDVVGSVQKIETDPNGKPLRVDILLSSNKTALSLPADAVSYDETANTITPGPGVVDGGTAK
jgi:hypothetical protein